jgi:hypothetical protein
LTKRGHETRRIALAALAVALATCLAVSAPVAGAKKKKRGGGALNVTQAVNLPIPDKTPPPGTGPEGVLTTTINVGKKFKSLQVRDVNVTVQTVGTSGPTPADNLDARLIAPNGANSFLFSGLSGSAASPAVSIGPLTLDDEAALDLGNGLPTDPTQLHSPWAGAAAPLGQLWPMDGGPVRGTWTLQLFDANNTETSTLVSWGLNVVAGRPFQK